MWSKPTYAASWTLFHIALQFMVTGRVARNERYRVDVEAFYWETSAQLGRAQAALYPVQYRLFG
jgi:hypothetical protein